jgi:hypothetical protein
MQGYKLVKMQPIEQKSRFRLCYLSYHDRQYTLKEHSNPKDSADLLNALQQ